MQNKPNLPDIQMNVSIFSKMAYENISDWTLSENKPNSNPISESHTAAQVPTKITHFLRLNGYNPSTTLQPVICKFEKMLIS